MVGSISFVRCLPLMAALAVALAACAGDDAPEDVAAASASTVSYRYDGSEERLQDVQRLAGYYCKDRFGKSANLVRTADRRGAFARAYYQCI